MGVYILTFMLLLFGTMVDSLCPVEPDPCDPAVYKPLNDGSRSSNYADGNRRFQGDFLMEEAWYRSTSPAGGDMPTEIGATGGCDARLPMYRVGDAGDLPSLPDSIVDVPICTNYRGNCVNSLSYDMQVKNCGQYNVYCLKKPRYASQRYCFGTEVACPEGETSFNGFTPGCVAAPNLTLANDPTISASTVYEEDPPWGCVHGYHFSCDVTHFDTSVFFDVQWFAQDGRLIQESTGDNAVHYEDMPNVLSSDTMLAHANNYKMGTTLTCRVAARQYNTSTTLVGAPSEADFFIGAQIDGESSFIIVEGFEPAQYKVTFTIPFRCTGSCSDEDDLVCDEFGVDIVTPHNTEDTDICTTDNDVVLEADVDSAGCFIQLSSHSLVVPVHANPDHVYNPRREVVLQLKARESLFHPFWSEYELPRANIRIVDSEEEMLSGSICDIRDDPHIATFDSTDPFDNQLEGAFIVYKHTTLPILAEAYFKIPEDSNKYSHQCGGAVRSAGEVFVFDACRDDEPFYISTYDCDEGLTHMTVTELPHNRYQVLLPTGTRIEIGESRMSVYPSVFDYGRTEGLCGNFNGVSSDEDDKIIRGTGVADTPVPSPVFGDRFMEYNVFSESWRVSEFDSLYSGAVHDTLTYNPVTFCTCSNNTGNTGPGGVCSSIPNVDNCVGGRHKEASGKSHYCTIARRRRKRSAREFPSSDFDEDDREWPLKETRKTDASDWRNGWTEAKATEHCTELFNKDVYFECEEKVPHITLAPFTQSCIQDIFLTGNERLGELHVHAFEETCKEEARRFKFMPTKTNETEAQRNGSALRPRSSGDILSTLKADAVEEARVEEENGQGSGSGQDGDGGIWDEYGQGSGSGQGAGQNRNESHLTQAQQGFSDILEGICLNACSGHGNCTQGVCVCDAGYTDSDCSTELGHVPKLFKLPRRGRCDLALKPCEFTIVNADKFVAGSVHCRLALKDENGQPIGSELDVAGEYVHVQKAYCPIYLEQFELPDVQDLMVPRSYEIDISMSNDGLQYSAIKTLTVFTSEEI